MPNNLFWTAWKYEQKKGKMDEKHWERDKNMRIFVP